MMHRAAFSMFLRLLWLLPFFVLACLLAVGCAGGGDDDDNDDDDDDGDDDDDDDDDGDDDDDDDGPFTVMDSGTELSLTDVWGFAYDDVFAVGSEDENNDGVCDYIALRFDGQQWQTMLDGAGGCPYKVWGLRVDDLYVFGPEFLKHFDGADWADVSTALSGELAHTAMWGTTEDDIYLITLDFGTELFALQHFDGNDWSLMHTFDAGVSIWDLYGFAADDIYMGGSVMDPDETVAFFHYDGVSVELLDSELIAGYANSVHALQNSELFSVGTDYNQGTDPQTLLMWYEEDQWTAVPLELENAPVNFLMGVWGIETAYAVGYLKDSSEFSKYLIVSDQDGTWSELRRGRELDASYLVSAWGPSEQQVFFVGENGLILLYQKP